MTPPDEPLTTYLGKPIEPHRPSGVEAYQYYCADCGREVDSEDGTWFHEDAKYEPPEDQP